MEVLKSFGKTIKYYRKELNISQEGLAAICGFHITYVGQIERGERNPSLINIKIFTREFKITLSELFSKCEQIRQLD